MEHEFIHFPKMARLSREMIITEKIDGTNAQILITEDGQLYAGSRNRWITPQSDNYGFAAWVVSNMSELMKLGPGRHFGEWWGSGIQRGYNLPKGEKRFSLFNVTRWALHGTEPGIIETMDPKAEPKYQQVLPECVGLVPVLYKGMFNTDMVEQVLLNLSMDGSQASPGFHDPEGIVVFHTAANICFKKTIKDDHLPKSLTK